MGLSTRQRRDRILAQLHQAGQVAARALAAELGVSEATIRRDLRALAAGGQVQLVYGGAALARPYDFSFSSRLTRNLDAKRAIGRLAAALVSDGDTVFLDSGTTCFQMVPFLKARRGLKVIANSARLALELDAPGLDVILIGGQYRPQRMDTVGPLATSVLEQLRGYVAFIGSDGLSMDFGLTAVDIESASLYRLAVRNARETVLLADHDKFTSPSLFKIVDWDAVSRVATDREVEPAWAEFLSGRGVDIVAPAVEADTDTQGAAASD